VKIYFEHKTFQIIESINPALLIMFDIHSAYWANIGKSHPKHNIVIAPVTKNKRLKLGKTITPIIVQINTILPRESEYRRFGLARPAPGLSLSKNAKTNAQKTPRPANVGFTKIIVPNMRREGSRV